MKVKVEKSLILNGYDAEISKVHQKLITDICCWKEWNNGLAELKAILHNVSRLIELMKAKEQLEDFNVLNFDMQPNYKSKDKR